MAPPPLQTQYPSQPNVYDSSAPPPKRSLPPGVQGPVAPNLKIADKVLESAAGKADDVHDAFYAPAASLEGLTLSASKALEGFATADALKRSHENWEEQAGLVTAWLNNISKSLRQAALAYNDTDHGVKDGFSPYLKQSAPSGGSDAVYPPSYGPYLSQNGGE
ncbi:WXG100 family type VII secretion target [Streptomyces sp. BRA346]|uniref:WXG100 family type VII secretion target n=1 Tax=Streptomyces sp. BRA346 TaxID=2878199 RepID=UPI0040633CE1